MIPERIVFCPQVLRHAGKKQMLIFVHSRKETAKTAKYLKETAMANETLAKFMSVSHYRNQNAKVCKQRS